MKDKNKNLETDLKLDKQGKREDKKLAKSGI